uniref:Non-specific serine/threonine protein kinase n=1 Tax=Elaeophora elaphi TaxID=1147741 RepID=A0A0R3RNZ4_9BILA
MIAAWEEYKRRTYSCRMNPVYFSAHQNYLLIAVENGGISLENYEISTMLQAYSIVYQLIMAIAVAECRLHFEHRDLGYENILITSASWNDIIRCHFNGSAIDIHTYGARMCLRYILIGHRIKNFSINNIWRAFWPVTNVLWVGYIVDCIYHRLERSRISCSLARRAFLDHFQHLHGYGENFIHFIRCKLFIWSLF